MKSKLTRRNTTAPMEESTIAEISSHAAPPAGAPNALPDSIVVFNLQGIWLKFTSHLAKAKKVLTKCTNALLAKSGDDDTLYDPKDAPWKSTACTEEESI